MNRMVHLGSVLAIAVHMVFGCCLHHAHASDWPAVDRTASVADSGLTDSTELSAKPTCCCCHHGSKGTVQKTHGQYGQMECSCDRQLPQHQCHGDQCRFTRHEPFDFANFSACCDSLFSLSLDWEMLASDNTNQTSRPDLTATLRGDPVPLHLLNQAILL